MNWFKNVTSKIKKLEDTLFVSFRDKLSKNEVEIEQLRVILKEQDMANLSEMQLLREEVHVAIASQYTKWLGEIDKSAAEALSAMESRLDLTGVRLSEVDKKLVEVEEKLVDLTFDLETAVDTVSKKVEAQDTTIVKEFDDIKREVGGMVRDMKSDLNLRLVEFSKENIDKVAEKYFTTLADIFRWNREFSFLDKYINQDTKTLEGLRKTLQQPILAQQYKINDQNKGVEIESSVKSKGELILQQRRKLHDAKIRLEREKKPTAEVDQLIKQLDWVTGGIK